MPMTRLLCDIETYSAADLPSVGVYRYTDDPSFEIILLSYKIDDADVETVDLTEQSIPEWFLDALTDPEYVKEAWNAQFERVSFTRILRRLKRLGPDEWLDPRQWRDTMVQAMELGLPASLKQAANYLGVDQVKDPRGVRLIRYFSTPTKPTVKQPESKRNMPADAPEDWELYKSYNAQDVRTEAAIGEKLSTIKMAEHEWDLWAMDQRINDRGVRVDKALAAGAIDMMEHANERNMGHLKGVTGLDNPNSLTQLKKWLRDQGTPMEKLGKALVQEALDSGKLPSVVADALETRLKLSNSSTKKYLMMEDARCSDGKVHGLLQFYGASRTGRWAGRLLQVQNLPRNYIEDLDLARSLVKAEDAEGIDLLYGDMPNILKQLIRTGLVASPGHRLVVCDFSAIEARVIAWYAGEEWTLDAFRTHGKIYEATASQMFNIPMAKIDKQTRQKGKVATLALGYQGSVGALKAMGALNMGLTEDELPDLVDKWRNANKHVVRFWYDCQRAVETVLSGGGVVRLQKGLKFYKRKGFLFIQLPSGRRLAYAKPRLEQQANGHSRITYDGQGDRVGFTRLDTYGGKIVENIVQATARDLLADAMLRLEAGGYPVIMHIHDEAVADVPDGFGSVADMRDIMCQAEPWAEGLPLNAAGFESSYYKKD